MSQAFYTAVTQSILLFGEETWVLLPQMEKDLDSSKSSVARNITGRQPRQRKDESWIYPPLAGIMKKAVMVGIRTSILRRQNTVARYIVTRPILDLCKQATRRQGARVSRRWWEQTGVYLNGAQEKATEAAAETETESESEDEPDGAAG